MAKNYEVLIAGHEFDQKNITIAVGDTVTWINDDAGKHTVTQDPGSPLSFTEVVIDGSTYSPRQTFSAAGVLKYHCRIHPSMTGSVTVA
jgi:plastocyanin